MPIMFLYKLSTIMFDLDLLPTRRPKSTHGSKLHKHLLQWKRLKRDLGWQRLGMIG